VVPPAAPQEAGDTAIFGVGVGNASAFDAPTVDLTLTQYPAVAGVQVEAPAGWDCDAPVPVASYNRIDCRIASFAKGSQAGFVVRVPVTAALEGEALHVGASINSIVVDPDYGNNTDDQSVAVQAPADLVVEVDAPNGKHRASETAVFQVHAGNIGTATARDVVLGLNLNVPASRVAMAAAPGWACTRIPVGPHVSRWTCTRATLAPGEDQERFRFDIAPDPRKTTGQLTLAATIEGASRDADAGNDTSTGSVRVVAK
jgi:hypothetical protein